MRRSFVWLVLLLAACQEVSVDFRDSASCSTAGTCPPDQVCVASENLCRRPCSTPGVVCTGASCECGEQLSTGLADMGARTVQEQCDVDGYCRPSCGPCPGAACACPEQMSCDTVDKLCRPVCSAKVKCLAGATCVAIPKLSMVCRPAPLPKEDMKAKAKDLKEEPKDMKAEPIDMKAVAL